MTEQFTPSEEQIARVLSQTKSDPRKLAVAYLRAQNRAKQANLAFGLMSDIQDLTMGVVTGDVNAVRKASEQAKRRTRASEDRP